MLNVVKDEELQKRRKWKWGIKEIINSLYCWLKKVYKSQENTNSQGNMLISKEIAKENAIFKVNNTYTYLYKNPVKSIVLCMFKY